MFFCLIYRKEFADIISLYLIAAHKFEYGELFLGFHSFGYNLQVKGVGNLDDGFDNRS